MGGVVKKDVETVQRLVEKGKGFNGEILKPRMYLLFPSKACVEAKGNIRVAMLVKGQPVASGTIPLSRIGEHADMEVTESIRLKRLRRRGSFQQNPVSQDGHDDICLVAKASMYILRQCPDDEITTLVSRVLNDSCRL